MSKLITPEFTGRFVNVLTPKAFDPTQDPKYSVVIALPKTDKFWKDLDEAINAAAEAKFGEVPKKLKTFIKDGDEDEYIPDGHFAITASNKKPVGVLVKTDKGLVEPTSDSDIYAGAVYRASIRPYAYSYQNSKGVAISLDNILKVAEGERIGGRTDAKEDFKDFLEDNSWD